MREQGDKINNFLDQRLTVSRRTALIALLGTGVGAWMLGKQPATQPAKPIAAVPTAERFTPHFK